MATAEEDKKADGKGAGLRGICRDLSQLSRDEANLIQCYRQLALADRDFICRVLGVTLKQSGEQARRRRQGLRLIQGGKSRP